MHNDKYYKYSSHKRRWYLRVVLCRQAEEVENPLLLHPPATPLPDPPLLYN